MTDHSTIRTRLQRGRLSSLSAPNAAIVDSHALAQIAPEDAEGEALLPGYPQDRVAITIKCGDCGRPILESQRVDGAWMKLEYHAPNWGEWPGKYPRCRSCSNTTVGDVIDRLAFEGASCPS